MRRLALLHWLEQNRDLPSYPSFDGSFLRERRILIEGSETRLYVTDTDLVIEGNKTSRKRRRCVPMDQNHIRFHFFHDWIKFFKDSSRDI